MTNFCLESVKLELTIPARVHQRGKEEAAEALELLGGARRRGGSRRCRGRKRQLGKEEGAGALDLLNGARRRWGRKRRPGHWTSLVELVGAGEGRGSRGSGAPRWISSAPGKEQAAGALDLLGGAHRRGGRKRQLGQWSSPLELVGVVDFIGAGEGRGGRGTRPPRWSSAAARWILSAPGKEDGGAQPLGFRQGQ